MKNPRRITVAFDKSTVDLLEKIKKETDLSQSEIIRRALRFYHENKAIREPHLRRKVYTYIDMLLSGEHIILDVDHWLLFLDLIETSSEKERFWDRCRRIARAHAEQLRCKINSARDLLERLETCNFFRLNENSENEFTLVLLSEAPKKFIRIFLEEFFSVMGMRAEIREDLAKLRISIRD